MDRIPAEDPVFGGIVRSDETGRWSYDDGGFLTRLDLINGRTYSYVVDSEGGILFHDGLWRFKLDSNNDLVYLHGPGVDYCNPFLNGCVAE